MSLKSFVCSQVARLNKKWVERSRRLISLLNLSANTIPLSAACSDISDTSESSDIIYACLVQNSLIFSFIQNGKIKSGKHNAFCQLAREARPSAGPLMHRIESEVFASVEKWTLAKRLYVEENVPIEKTFCMHIAKWGVEQLADPQWTEEGLKATRLFLEFHMQDLAEAIY